MESEFIHCFHIIVRELIGIQSLENVNSLVFKLHNHACGYIIMLAGSGWVVDKMICAHLNITKYSPMRVGKHIPIPAKIKNKRCLLNIQNDDNQ